MRAILLVLFGAVSITFTRAQLNFCLATDCSVSVPMRLNSEDSVSTLRFYISNVRIMHGGKIVWRAEKEHYLIDFNQDQLENNNVIGYEGSGLKEGVLKFILGVDDNTSTKGIGEGPLDPIRGMYWTWQSGYINFKLEGASNQCPTKKNKFQLHLGGFQEPYRTTQNIELKISGEEEAVVFNLKKLMTTINLKEDHTVMSPGEKAVYLMQNAKSCFYAK